MRDKATGRSRGFGFLTYEDMDSLDKSLDSPKHELDGRSVEVKRAIPRGEVKTIRRKLFVGGVSPTTTSESLRDAFIRFGPIAEAQIMKDRMRGRSRGFGFVTFEDDESILQALGTSDHRVDGKLVDVKRAEPKKRTPGGPTANPLAHNYASPNASPRGPMAFTSPVIGGYPMNFTLLPYPVLNNEFSSSGSNLGNFTNPGYSDAPATYLFASPYASPRGSFAIGETDLPTDFAELSMGRRYSHDFAAALPSYSANSGLEGSNNGYGSGSHSLGAPGSTNTNSSNSGSSSHNGIPTLSLPNNSANMAFQQLQQQQQQPQLVSPRNAEINSPNASSFGSMANSFYLPSQYQQMLQMQHQLFLHQQQQQQQYQSTLSPTQIRAHGGSGNVMRQDSANGAAAPQTPSPDSNSPALASPTPQSRLASLNKESEKEEAVVRSQTPVSAIEGRRGARNATPVPRTSTPIIAAPIPKDHHHAIASPVATRALDGKMGVDHENDHPRSAAVSSPVTVPLAASRSTPQFA